MTRTTLFFGGFLLLLCCVDKGSEAYGQCKFSVAILNHENQNVSFKSDGLEVLQISTGRSEKATEISGNGELILTVPTDLEVFVGGSLSYSARIRNCDKLGIAVVEGSNDLDIVHLDDFFFE